MQLYRLFLRVAGSQSRVLGLGLFGALVVVQALFIRNTAPGPRDQLATQVVSTVGLNLLAPIIALVFSSAALGDLVDDGTLVYVWMRPIARARIVAAALGAVLTFALPLSLVPIVVVAAILFADGTTLIAAAAATVLATLGYSTLFLGLGLRVRRALPWGLAYILVWEGAVARAARGAARLSIQVHASSVFARMADSAPPRLGSSTGVAVGALVLLSLVATATTAWWLTRIEVA